MYALTLGQLYNFLVMGEKTLLTLSITPVLTKSLVKIKNGKSDGKRIFAQISMPLKATAEYFAGFMVIRIITKNNKIPIKIFRLFEIFLL